MIKSARFLFTYITPVLAFMALIAPYLGYGAIWVNHAGILLLASSIGFYTNFIAINMLFRPHERTFLGRQGVIPKQKQQIASQLAKSINDEFFNPHEIADYLRCHRLPEKAVNALFKYTRAQMITPVNVQRISGVMQQWLNKPANQKKLEAWLDSMNLQQRLIEQLKKQDVAAYVKSLIEKEIKKNPQAVEQWVDRLCFIAAEYVPDVAQFLYQELQDYIEQQNALKRSMASLMGFSSEVNQETLKNHLFRFISTFEFREAIYHVIAKMNDDILAYLDSEQGREWLQGLTQRHQKSVKHYFHQKVVPSLLQAIVRQLSQASTQRQLNYCLLIINRKVKAYTHSYIASTEFELKLKQLLPGLMQQLQLQRLIHQKLSHYDSRQLESLLMRASKSHLQTIEVLGGAIGAFTGIALIDLTAFAAVLLSGMAVWLCDMTLTRWHSNRS